MKSAILEKLGIDPAIIFIILIIMMIAMILLYINVNMKYNRLKNSYATFMRGKDAKTLEESFGERFAQLEGVDEMIRKNRQDVKNIFRRLEHNYQKLGIVKYDAFNEMGGNLSYALTILDNENNGFIMNAIHSREGCYNYVKEVVKGESFIELSAEERESLDKAIYQEAYKLDVPEA